MLKNKIFKYIIIEYFKLFLLISLSLSILIWMTQAARLLELITELGNPVTVYIKFLILNYPKILNNVFLLSFAVSLFFLYAKFESSNELGIYWLSGISKNQFVKITFVIAFLSVTMHLILSAYISPKSLSLGRKILGQSQFSLINSLVKEKNFNSPLRDLTIYIESNDQKGNLNGVFIYEKARTIMARRGEVLTNNGDSYLKLYDGITHEKTESNINIINFKNTMFDFSKYQMQNIKTLKFSERSTYWLIQNLNSKNKKKNEIREELNKRLISPFYIFLISICCGFLLYSNNEKINLKKMKSLIYLSVIISLILNQIFLGFSGKNIFFTILYFLMIFLLSLTLYFFQNKLFQNEAK